MKSKQIKKLLLILATMFISITLVFLLPKDSFASDLQSRVTDSMFYSVVQKPGGPFTSVALDYLQSSAVNPATVKRYTEFDPSEIMKWHKRIGIDVSTGWTFAPGISYSATEGASLLTPGTTCITPQNHFGSVENTIECILDVTETKVIVWLNGGTNSVIKREFDIDTSNPDKDYAHQLAFLAYMANLTGERHMAYESLPACGYESYQGALRYQIFSKHWNDFFAPMGLPDELNPKGFGAATYDQLAATERAYTLAKIQMTQAMQAGKTYVGRFIFEFGYDWYGTDGTFYSGQNQLLFGGYETEISNDPIIEIDKRAKDTGKPMAGVQFTVQNAADNKYFNLDGELSTQPVTLTTDANGKITIKNKKNEKGETIRKTCKRNECNCKRNWNKNRWTIFIKHTDMM